MKKKINKMLVLIAGLAILMTMIFLTMVYYDLFCEQVMEDLQGYTLLLKEYQADIDMEPLGQKLEKDNMRLTLIEQAGSVTFDSRANISEMGNHGGRPEVLEAVRNGKGQSIRHSETFSKNTFYFAVSLEDGRVLRIAKDASSIYNVFLKSIPILLIVLLVLIWISFIVAKVLTAKLISPVEKLAENIEGYQNTTDYDELTPFIDMIKKQHRDIIKNARIRQEFTANVSHELKTPLTSISGYAELIENGMASDTDIVHFANGIHKSANRLLTLINDIIRLSELDGTEEELVFEKINLYELAEICVDMLNFNAQKHQVSITLEGAACYVMGNKQMLEELLFNLCDNAIRYNNVGGSVQVQVKQKENLVMLRVKDTGIGIPKEHQNRIFERFYRVDKSRSKSTGGTGLGLAIVKHIVVKHNARMELDSKVGEGTTIKVFFYI